MIKEVLIIADSDLRKEIVGGIGVYSYHLTKYLTKKGLKVIFLGKKHDGNIINHFNNLTYVDVNKKPNQSNFTFLRNLFKISKKINLNENVVIHTQRPDWLLPFKNFKNKKIVTLHGSHSKNVYLKKGLIIGKIYSKLEKDGLKIADIIISVSEENARYYKKIYRKYPEITRKIITIPTGVDLSNFRQLNKYKLRKKYGFNKHDKVVVYVGRFEKEKNLEFLIQGCHKANVKLLLVGKGREERKLKDLAMKLKANVIFQGPVNNKKIPEILICGDVFALTSLYEGLPTVIIEALATGIPIISTNVGDIKKLVVDGKTGFIFDKNNIVKKLKILIKNHLKYKKNCIAKAKNYSWDKIGEKIVEQYKK